MKCALYAFVTLAVLAGGLEFALTLRDHVRGSSHQPR